MKSAATRLNEASEVTIPLRNLISMIAFTAVSVWVYFGLTERISFLEHNLEMVTIERVRQLEIEIAKIKLMVGTK